MTSTTDEITAPDGTRLLTRSWKASDPWAAMLVVHGLGEHTGRYEATGADFAAAGIDVTAFDLRGHGGSDGRRAYVDSFEDFLGDVEHRLAALGSDLPTVLLGHSLGGLIAFTYAVSARPAPDLLVLSAPALAASVPGAKRAAAKVLSRVAPKLALPNDIKGDQLSSDPAVGEAYFADPLVYTKTTARLGAEMLAAMAASDAGAPSMPTLVIHGTADTIVPPTASARLGQLGNVERHLLSGFRHESFNEVERARAVTIVIDWLRAAVAP